jgi:hypothetical protein
LKEGILVITKIEIKLNMDKTLIGLISEGIMIFKTQVDFKGLVTVLKVNSRDLKDSCFKMVDIRDR